VRGGKEKRGGVPGGWRNGPHMLILNVPDENQPYRSDPISPARKGEGNTSLLRGLGIPGCRQKRESKGVTAIDVLAPASRRVIKGVATKMIRDDHLARLRGRSGGRCSWQTKELGNEYPYGSKEVLLGHTAG